MERSPKGLRVCAAATHNPLDPRTFSGLSAHLFTALMVAGASISPVRTRDIRTQDLTRGALDFRPLLRGRRPRVRAGWQWSRDACVEQSARATDRVWSLPVDAILQVGTHVQIEHPSAIRACITDATVVQAIDAGEFSVARSGHAEDAIAWQREVFHSMDRIFTLSQWAADSVINDYGVDAHRVVVSGAGANLDPPLPRNDDQPMVLFVGRDWEQKGGPAILDAYRHARAVVPDLALVIVGCDPPVNEPGVTVVGPLDRRDPFAYAQLRALYSRATMFALCSRFDAFPNVLLEAQWSGVPVIAYNEASRPEAVLDGVTGILVARTEPLELAAAFVELATDRDRAQTMGAAGAAHVADRFTWPVVTARILDALSAIRPDEQETRSSGEFRTPR